MICMKSLGILFFLCVSVFGQWSARVSKPEDKGRGGSVRLSLGLAGTESPLMGVFADLKEAGTVLLVDDCWTDLLKHKEQNRELVRALGKVSGSSLEDLSEAISKGSFNHPDVVKFRAHLSKAVLSLPRFEELSEELGDHGLGVTGVNCEKFSFFREEGQLLISGAGLYLTIEPTTFGLPAVKGERKGHLALQDLKKEGEEWVGIFRLSTSEKGPIPIHGKWSTEHDCYLITQRDLAWTKGQEWGRELTEKIGPKDASFQIKPDLSYTVRIPLGKSSQPRAMVRIYSSAGQALRSQEFILGEASSQFREE